jgi:ABC-type Fe3+-hydroxamate transport system substrate-binding protein
MRLVLLLRLLFILLIPTTALAELRLVVLSPDLTENIFALRKGDTVVGRVSSADFPDEVLNVPIIGDYQSLDAEAIVKLDPDYVLAWKGGNSERQLTYLESLGLKLVRIKGDTLADIPSQLTELGRLLEAEAEADNLIAEYHRRLANSRVNAEKPKRVFYQLWSDPMLTLNAQSVVSETIAHCGGVNLFKDRSEMAPQVSIESVISVDPDLILASDGLPENWQEAWQNWPFLNAVKHQRLYKINSDYLHRLTMRTLDGVDEVCEILNSLD